MKILVFTSTRADSGILSPFVDELLSREGVEVEVLATGTHLEESFGNTLSEEIGAWGELPVHAVSMRVLDSSSLAWARSMGELLSGLGTEIDRLKPDAALLVGDRAEALIFSLACNFLGIPLIHLHGGEVTLGAQDESYRHSITKLSHLHFPTSKAAARRIVQLGEQPERVFFFAPLVNSRLTFAKETSKAQLAEKFGFAWGQKTALVTFHGAKFDDPPTLVYVKKLLTAIQNFPDLNVIFTGPNIDPESSEIRKLILKHVEEHSETAFFVESFGAKHYLSVLRLADIAIGNSSSLVLEAPVTGTRALIIGSRQQGRSEGASSLLAADSGEITKEIRRILTSGKPHRNESNQLNPAPLIVDEIMKFDFRDRKKTFYNY